jgi:ribosomal-protein-alanine acetyltransferase
LWIASGKSKSGTMTEVTIAPMTVSHIGAVMKIEKSVFKDPWSAASFVEVMSFSPNNWIAKIDGHIVGYLITQFILDEIHILNVAVANEMHRKGVATKLLAVLVAEGRKHGMRDMFLEVRVGNAGAIALYERHGFRQLSVRKKYYPNGEDALVMHCAMPEDSAVDSTGSKIEEK